MKSDQQLRELEAVAEGLGIKVSYEKMAGLVTGTGGLCRLRGQYVVIIDRRLKAPERAQLLADALARFDTTDLEMSDAARGLIGGNAA